MKFPLIYLDGCGDYHNLNEELWNMQRQVREISNFTIQELYHWDHEDQKFHAATGEHLSISDQTGYKRIDGYIYNVLKDKYTNMYSLNFNDAVQRSYKKYKDVKSDVLSGKMSLPSYRQDQPILLNKKVIKFIRDPVEGMTMQLALFSEKYKKEKEYSNVRFRIVTLDSTQKSIIDRIDSKEYQYGQCQLKIEKKQWYFTLTYIFEPEQHSGLDPDKILGVDMGSVFAIYASSKGEYGRFKIPGDEVDRYAQKLEAVKYAKQSQARYCGDGRIGHGTKTRVESVYKTGDDIARFRDTINHRYSKALVDYAVKFGYGTIQMEDLSGIKENTGFPKKLRHWTYYDLQTKIKNKAAEHGIEVKLIKPKYTSQRCSKCGHIDKENRKTQDTFKCISCGYTVNADFNASQNISIADIDKIIEKEIKCANPEHT